jgi:nucleoside triphosphate diphosphatase
MEKSQLDGITSGLEPLAYACALQQRAADIGFDWPDAVAILAKVEEELEEVREALASGDHDAIEDELGDLLFVIVNLARKSGLHADTALQRACAKFTRRFRLMEQAAAQEGSCLEEETLEQMEARWQVAKRQS